MSAMYSLIPLSAAYALECHSRTSTCASIAFATTTKGTRTTATSSSESSRSNIIREDSINQRYIIVVPLLRFVEESNEDWVVQELGADHEPFHLVVDIDRDVAIRDYQFSSGGSPAPELHTERFVSARDGGGVR
ncbi:hypothetical protein C1H46_000146 [Malus baccata]|uniref:Uncharacterized protein n=1 Tax=Malus baccata TaxID=106549 RepID=A0A540NT90_MALBA|nr:hypothetical protein C1H46_000146 [Malus baccata]